MFNYNEPLSVQEETKKEYKKYVEEITPRKKLGSQLLKAFVTGGLICCTGQLISDIIYGYTKSDEITPVLTSLALIFISVVLTGFNIYPKIAAFGGAGALVPITGFANSVCAPAVEYKKEGQVFGIGCKIFSIAGPVILYGILASWIVGVIYWCLAYLKII